MNFDAYIQNGKGKFIPENRICIISLNFMDSIEKEDYGNFNVIVKSYYPENCYYHITIQKSDENYFVTSFLLDV